MEEDIAAAIQEWLKGGCLRGEAVAVLEVYKRKRGTVYNSRKGF